jgi:hypothetical protein
MDLKKFLYNILRLFFKELTAYKLIELICKVNLIQIINLHSKFIQIINLYSKLIHNLKFTEI